MQSLRRTTRRLQENDRVSQVACIKKKSLADAVSRPGAEVQQTEDKKNVLKSIYESQAGAVTTICKAQKGVFVLSSILRQDLTLAALMLASYLTICGREKSELVLFDVTLKHFRDHKGDVISSCGCSNCLIA